MLERSGLAEDLLKTMGQLFGSLRGGLALSVVFVGTLLAAATGVVGATVVAMGLISLPVMLRHHYSRSLSTGVIAASGTLGQIIPPSIVLIVIADQLGVSVGALFRGALLPGLALAVMFALYCGTTAMLRPDSAPALPAAERPDHLRGLLVRVALVMVPPLVLILMVLGSIFAGVATPTEAGAFGAAGAGLLAAANRRLTLATVRETEAAFVKDALDAYITETLLPEMRRASSGTMPSSPRQKRRTASRYLSFHSAQPTGKAPAW